jgi:FixJ family two-component response regulator
MSGMSGDRRCVYVVDDDQHMRTSISRLLLVSGYRHRVFESAVAYLEAVLEPCEAACLVLDVRMPELSGIELQQRLAGSDHDVPIVFVSAHGDIPMAVQTLKAGAVSFLQKPFDPDDLLRAVEEALGKAERLAEQVNKRSAVQRKYSLLSPREREVFWKVTQGLLNKQIAAELGIAEKTVKIHRARVMLKMEATSVAELVRLSEQCAENAAHAE